MTFNRQESKTISAQAAEWLVVLAEGGAEEQTAFLAWLKKSPQHVEEFLFATTTWRKLRQIGAGAVSDVEQIMAEALGVDAASNVVALPEQKTALESGFSRARALSPRFRWAAGFAAVALAAVLGWWALDFGSTYSTDVGEQRTVRLEDGSVLYLNTASRAKVAFSEDARTIELMDGEALFVVAHDSGRPFRVTAGTAVIQAVGTQFNVRRRVGGTRVSVIEGRVKVANPTKDSPLLTAGEEVTIGGNGRIVKTKAPDIAQAVAWRERRLVFKAETLENVVAEINRYSTRQFRIESESARDTRLTATFDADKPESLAAFLQQYSDLSVEVREDDFVIRRRAQSGEPVLPQ